jgi:hypothetical protein
MAPSIQPPACLLLDKLPSVLVEHVLSLCSIRCQGKVGCTCTELRTTVARVASTTERIDVSGWADVAISLLLPRFCGLRVIALHGSATDSILLAAISACPRLEELDISDSCSVSDRGVSALSSLTGLRRLRAVFCPGVSYIATLLLRDAAAANGRVVDVQRLPGWLVGRFYCPWGERHDYFADGSFLFDREEQAAGYVLAGECVEHSDSVYISSTLQYVDFAPPAGWPLWARYVYRPGVLARRPAPGEDANLPLPTVFILQHAGLPAPRRAPAGVQWAALPPGETHYHDAMGRPAPAGAGQAEREAGGFDLMISRMMVEALPGGKAAAPPAALLERIRAFERERAERMEGRDEAVLASMLVSALAN